LSGHFHFQKFGIISNSTWIPARLRYAETVSGNTYMRDDASAHDVNVFQRVSSQQLTQLINRYFKELSMFIPKWHVYKRTVLLLRTQNNSFRVARRSMWNRAALWGRLICTHKLASLSITCYYPSLACAQSTWLSRTGKKTLARFPHREVCIQKAVHTWAIPADPMWVASGPERHSPGQQWPQNHRCIDHSRQRRGLVQLSIARWCQRMNKMVAAAVKNMAADLFQRQAGPACVSSCNS